MTRTRHRNLDREHFWRQVIADWKKSSQSIRAFCSKRELNQASFYAWRRELAQRDQKKMTKIPSTSFVPLRVVADATVEVVLPGGIIVRVPVGVDA